jgi:hypothetical protein
MPAALAVCSRYPHRQVLSLIVYVIIPLAVLCAVEVFEGQLEIELGVKSAGPRCNQICIQN